MGRSQSRVIGEVLAPVALLSGIALSPENTVRYGRHRRKNCDLGSVAFPRTSRYWVYPSFLLLLVSSCGSVTANTLLSGIAPSRPPPGPCSLLIGWFSLLWPRAHWLGLVVGVSDLPPLPLTGHALLLVRFRWVYSLSFRLPHSD